MLLATRCPLCGRVGPAPCEVCIATLERAPALAPPPGLDAAAALLRYDGAGRDLVTRLKYRNARAAVPWLAAGMAGLVAPEPAVVTWVPTSAARRRHRGFDQSRLLARAVARHLDRPCLPLLRRDGGAAQTGLSRADRLTGPSFSALPGFDSRPVLLVDDVITTGATASAAARALRLAGVDRVEVVAAARTPPFRRRSRP